MLEKLLKVMKEIKPLETDHERVLEWALENLNDYPGQLHTIVEEPDKKWIQIEYLPITYKEKECMEGSDPDIDEYCLCIMCGDDFVLDNVYFIMDITDKQAKLIKDVWNKIKGE